jgi:ABC-type nickel/cobalt efflux system permease component RcnA
MERNNNNTSKGIGFAGLLTIAFIVLKLCKVISWSWVWVLAPLWISFGLSLVAIIVCVLIALIVKAVSKNS